MKQHKETNEEIRKRLKNQLDSTEQDEMYAVKMLLGFEPLDDWNSIRKSIEENNQKSTS